MFLHIHVLSNVSWTLTMLLTNIVIAKVLQRRFYHRGPRDNPRGGGYLADALCC